MHTGKKPCLLLHRDIHMYIYISTWSSSCVLFIHQWTTTQAFKKHYRTLLCGAKRHHTLKFKEAYAYAVEISPHPKINLTDDAHKLINVSTAGWSNSSTPPVLNSLQASNTHIPIHLHFTLIRDTQAKFWSIFSFNGFSHIFSNCELMLWRIWIFKQMGAQWSCYMNNLADQLSQERRWTLTWISLLTCFLVLASLTSMGGNVLTKSAAASEMALIWVSSR